MIRIYTATLLMFLLIGCAPMRVTTNIKQKSGTTINPDSVKVFMPQDSTPETTIHIGEISVIDNGFSKTEPLHKVIALAVNKTAQSGANILKITEYLQPSWDSRCHQFSGNMLYEKSEEVLNSYPNYMEEYQSTTYISQGKDKSYSSLGALVGPGFLLSTIHLPYNEKAKANVGISYQANLRTVFGSGFGFGFLYSGGNSSCDSYYFSNFKIRYDYFAPEFVGGLTVTDNFKIHATFGLGYYSHKERYKGIKESYETIGYHFNLGLDHIITQNFALGIEVQSLTAIYNKNSKLSVNGEAAKISRINAFVTLKYYF